MTITDISTRNLLQAAVDIERRGGLITLTNVDVAHTLRCAAATIDWLKGEVAKYKLFGAGNGMSLGHAAHAATDVHSEDQD